MSRENEGDTSNYLKYRTRNPLVQRLIHRFLSEVIEQIGEIRPERIVDIGCGEGQLARQLDKLPFPVDYRGFEINPEAIDIARRLSPARSFYQADLFQLDLEEGAADLVVCLEVLEHLADPEAAVARLARWSWVMRPRT